MNRLDIVNLKGNLKKHVSIANKELMLLLEYVNELEEKNRNLERDLFEIKKKEIFKEHLPINKNTIY